jgi:mono/diheme cytochrome c family protein
MRPLSISLVTVAFARPVLAALAVGFFGLTAHATDKSTEALDTRQHHLDERHKEYVYGIPVDPTQDWTMSSGGRLYDNWMQATDRKAPEGTHPSWPKSNAKTGEVTWRCTACHGWDYKGVEGKYGSGSYKTGIKGVTHMHGSDPARILNIIRNDVHRYTPELITDEEGRRLGLFLSRGLFDMDAYIDRKTGQPNGLASRGARYFQNVCAACHGFQGTKLDWGQPGTPAYVGTEANANPWEVLHKIRDGHPGHEMVALRPFPMDVSVDILTYIRTLPQK